MPLPATPGIYYVRLYTFLNPGWQQMATSSQIVTAATTPSILADGIAAPNVVTKVTGSTLTVSVSDGPGHVYDWVALAPVGAAAQTYADWWWLTGTKTHGATGQSSATFSVTLPQVPGDYELRFWDYYWNRLATSGTVAVAAPSPPAAPEASPAAGVYANAVTIALSSVPDTTIRYTLNGSQPSAVSTLYGTPIPITSGTTVLKAVALRTGAPPSVVLTASYTIDTALPTITGHRFPGPLNTWHLTPVTVSFICADNVGVATCSAPSTISAEGAGQTVTGTAVDVVGRETALVETLNLDLTPPTVTLSSPADGLVTSDTTVQFTGQVADALSGLAAVNCNGTAITVVDGQVSCSVPLRPGRNDVVLTARDAAGNSTSAGVSVTRVGTITRITLSPATRTMLVDETATLSLRDDFGVAATAATWTSSNTNVVSLSADDPPVLTAVEAGQATVTATKNGLNSVAMITVVVGTTLEDGSTRLDEGTTRWVVPPDPSLRRDRSVYTHRIDADGPDLFTVETNVTTWERTMRGLKASGEVLWMIAAPGVPLMLTETRHA